MDDLSAAGKIAASGMTAQGKRLRVIAENLANADTLPQAPGDQPYRRKIITFANELDRQMQGQRVEVDDIREQPGPFELKYMPSHPAADENGYVAAPNVDPLVEMMDMREAERSYQANLRVIDVARNMVSKTMELLR